MPLAVGPAMARTGRFAVEGEEDLQGMLTLVAPPASGSQPARLDASLTDAATAALAAAGARKIAAPDMFADGRAADIAFDGDARAEAFQAATRAVLGDKPVDYALQAAAPRRKALLIADMDSTIVTGETLDEMAAKAGIGEKVAAITARAMNGELDFRQALEERVGLLAGMDEAVFADAYAEVEITPGAEALVRAMRAGGAECRLVSGGFKYFVGRVAERLGFNGGQSNDIEVADGKLTGRVLEPVLDGSAKLAALERHAAALGLDLTATAAVGDGANDLPMLNASGLGVAWRAKPSVAAAARARVDHGDLTTLLLFQRMDPA